MATVVHLGGLSSGTSRKITKTYWPNGCQIHTRKSCLVYRHEDMSEIRHTVYMLAGAGPLNFFLYK